MHRPAFIKVRVYSEPTVFSDMPGLRYLLSSAYAYLSGIHYPVADIREYVSYLPPTRMGLDKASCISFDSVSLLHVLQKFRHRSSEIIRLIREDQVITVTHR